MHALEQLQLTKRKLFMAKAERHEAVPEQLQLDLLHNQVEQLGKELNQAESAALTAESSANSTTEQHCASCTTSTPSCTWPRSSGSCPTGHGNGTSNSAPATGSTPEPDLIPGSSSCPSATSRCRPRPPRNSTNLRAPLLRSTGANVHHRMLRRNGAYSCSGYDLFATRRFRQSFPIRMAAGWLGWQRRRKSPPCCHLVPSQLQSSVQRRCSSRNGCRGTTVA